MKEQGKASASERFLFVVALIGFVADVITLSTVFFRSVGTQEAPATINPLFILSLTFFVLVFSTISIIYLLITRLKRRWKRNTLPSESVYITAVVVLANAIWIIVFIFWNNFMYTNWPIHNNPTWNENEEDALKMMVSTLGFMFGGSVMGFAAILVDSLLNPGTHFTYGDN